MSDKDCLNDCTKPLRFPRRPGTLVPTSHADDCPCCTADITRVSNDNRPALSRFNYRIGTYGSIREFLFSRIDSTSALQTWTHRAPDDPAVALLEGASILGDILTFYQETYANEAFLRTAQWRESISDLVRLLGYRLSPAVGGKATFAFQLKKNEAVTVPAGFPVKATLEDFEKPSDFETVEEITAYPWLNEFNLYRTLNDGDITPATNEFYISLPEQLINPIELKVGDRLLIGQIVGSWIPDDGIMWDGEIVIIDSIRVQHGRKYYTIKGNLKRLTNISSLAAYRVGRSFHHFGYNSPAKIVDPNATVTSSATFVPATSTTPATTRTTSTIPYLPVKQSRPTSGTFTDPSVPVAPGETDYPLESEVKDLPGKMTMLLQATFRDLAGVAISPPRTVFLTVTAVKPATLQWGGVNGTVSQLQLYYPLNDYAGNNTTIDITTALFHEVTSPRFTIRRAKTETTVTSGNRLSFYGTAGQVKTLKNRRIMIAKPGADPVVMTVVSVPTTFDANTYEYPQLYPIDLSAGVTYADFPNDGPTVTVYGNLADADEGKTMPEGPIGSGDATQVFQNFKVPKPPLTYHVVPGNTPTETPELEIYVDGRLWTQVDSFFDRRADEQIYIVREDADGNSWVQFGDGKTGARLPSGVQNVTALYRMGSGAFGPLKVDTKPQASAKLKNLDKVLMPAEASGGAPAEDGDNARNAAPGKVQSLGRIVSMKDFETEAAAVPGVALASAMWQLVDGIPTVVVTILMETGRSSELTAVRQTLNANNKSRGAGLHPIDVVLGRRLYVTVTIEYALKPTYRADLVEPAILLALGVNYGGATRDEDQSGLFSLLRRRFGRAEYASSIEGTVQNVEGVLWARVIAFDELNDSDDPATIVLPATTVLEPVIACDSNFVLSLFDRHVSLTAVAEVGT
jgi:hypothetical protein